MLLNINIIILSVLKKGLSGETVSRTGEYPPSTGRHIRPVWTPFRKAGDRDRRQKSS